MMNLASLYRTMNHAIRSLVIASTVVAGLLLAACDSAVLIDPNATNDTGTVTGDNGTVDGGTVDGGTGDGDTADGGTADGGTADEGTGDGDTADNGTGDNGTGDNNGDATGVGNNPDATVVDLISTAEAAGNFNTLLAALDAANLRDTVADENSILTIFAPTDAAFDALGTDEVNALLADSDALNNTLLYHVLAGSNDASALTATVGTPVEMLNGDLAGISLQDNQLRINTSLITTTDILASNGVIHVIDTVLTPPVEINASNADQNVVQVLASDPQFTTLTSLLQATGLDTELASNESFTLFAPNNVAFSSFGEELIAALLQDTDTLRNILLNHVVFDERIDSADLLASAGTSFTSATGSPLAVMLNGNILSINDAVLARADINAGNGIIQELDDVIQP